jgi:hypothetical protein
METRRWDNEFPFTNGVVSNDGKGSAFSISRSPSGMSSNLVIDLSLSLN